MASDRRSSMSSARSAASQTSTSSNRQLPPPQIASVRPPSPLAAGSSLSGGAPVLKPPPSKDRLPLPMTPPRKPVQRQKSPLSTEAWSAPPPIAPPMRPETPSPKHSPSHSRNYSGSQNGQAPDSSPGSKGSKRLSSMRNFLPFKVMRRSFEHTSPDSSSMRPVTPGAESMMLPSAATPTPPSLRKKMSATFWGRRKSNLDLSAMSGDGESNVHGARTEDQANTLDPPASFAGEGASSSRPTTPVFGSLGRSGRRKSGTFWRRASSLTLTQTLNAEKMGWGSTKGIAQVEPAPPPNGREVRASSEQHTGPPLRAMTETNSPLPPVPQTEESSEYDDDDIPVMMTKRTTPPPQIPAFFGGGEGLGLGEDFFERMNFD